MCLHICLLGQAQQDSEKSVIYRDLESTIKLKGAPTAIEAFKWSSNDGISSTLSYDIERLTKTVYKSLLQVRLPLSEHEYLTLLIKEQDIASTKYYADIKTYRGVIIEEPQSWVTLNVTGTEINGIIARSHQNLILETTSEGLLELYNSADKPTLSWTCHSTDDLMNSGRKRGSTHKNQSHGDTVSVYIDCDYDLFRSRGSSITNTINYVQSLMNDVSVIYQNENITLNVDDIHVWDSVDPYDKDNVSAAIHNFRSHLNEEFDADLAILLSTNTRLSGGVAFVDGFCDKTRAYSYANLNSNIPNSSDYSWQTHVISHEIGHNLGSPHTNDCSWGPDGNQALDDCVSNSCSEVAGSVRGTIMSNCHLPGRGGVFFSRGFGQEPGDRIRAKIAECNAIEGKDCSEAITITLSGVDTSIQVLGPIAGSGASQADADASAWYQFIPPNDGFISMDACYQGVDTRLIIHRGSCNELNQLILQDDHCDIGSGLIYASAIDSFPVLADLSYYIEWDDRWSSEGFEYNFRYDQIIIPEDPCSNGILDNGEEQVDCGGTACIPCDLCDSADNSNLDNPNSYSVRSNDNILFTDQVFAPDSVIISSAQAVSFEAGFEIDLGSTLQALIESCAEYIDRIMD